jgi:cardiolipin hydrolase
MSDGWNFDIFLKYLRSARVSMDICVFTMTDDRVANILLANHKKGVKIRIITDNDTAKDNGSDIGKYQAAGIPCKVDKSPYHMHNKVSLVSNLCNLTHVSFQVLRH